MYPTLTCTPLIHTCTMATIITPCVGTTHKYLNVSQLSARPCSHTHIRTRTRAQTHTLTRTHTRTHTHHHII